VTDICFIDDETRSLLDVTQVSTGRYARSCDVIIVTYAINDGPVQTWTVERFGERLDWHQRPADLRAFEGKFVAFNSAFDRQTMHHGIDNCDLVVEDFLDAAVQAAAANLPRNLDAAAKAVGHDGKQEDGKALIRMFCDASRTETPQSNPEEWARMLSYAATDIDALRAVWTATLPLPQWQWQEFWAAERVNDRGLPIDMAFAEGARRVAAAYAERTNDRVKEITEGELYSVKQYTAQPLWCWDKLRFLPSVREIMVKRHDEDAEGGELIPTAFGLDRNRIVRMLAELERVNQESGLTDEEFAVKELLEEREFGASATPAKFGKAVDMAITEDGWAYLPSQYVFNGAQQTGRFSSRGVQVHNLARDTIKTEDQAIAEIADVPVGSLDEWLQEFEARHGKAGMVLSRLVRPLVTAPNGSEIVWGDWSNIEARKLPWLAGPDSRSALAKLQVFTDTDLDPEGVPDTYCRAAAEIDKIDLDDLWARYKDKDPGAKMARQKGKIAELALGFGGGNGALLSMAAAYRMSFSGEEASVIVKGWREANPWAVLFWDAVWNAFTAAAANPGTPYPAGRVVYMGVEGYLGNVTVLCFLPDGRALCYRNVKQELRNRELPDGTTIQQLQFTFAGAFGRKGLWYGTLAENVTQAVAASMLRATLVDLENGDHELFQPCGHTHDETIGMAYSRRADEAKEFLHRTMTKHRGWASDCPIAAEVSSHWYYTKSVD
jgi:DNA polymerase bacteriophage-type